MSWFMILGIILLAVGLAGLLVIIGRKVPILAKLPPTPVAPISWRGKIGEEVKVRLNGIKYSHFLPLFLAGLEKKLRQTRVWVLKTDNLFAAWIKSAREKSEKWTIRSRAWMEHRRFKKKEKVQVLEQLDKMEVSQTLQKIEKEVEKDEDRAFEEKVGNINEVNNHSEISNLPAEGEIPLAVAPEPELAVTPPSEEEKKYIDLIAVNPKDKDAYRALGFIYLNQKNYNDARACFRRVLKLDPVDEEVRNELMGIKGLKSKKNNA